jgi:hypothetical protein
VQVLDELRILLVDEQERLEIGGAEPVGEAGGIFPSPRIGGADGARHDAVALLFLLTLFGNFFGFAFALHELRTIGLLHHVR